MNFVVSVLLVSISLFGSLPKAAKIEASDLNRITGAAWTGSLTYMDYRSGKKVSIPSNLTVTQSAEDRQSWVFAYQYPEEPKANSQEIVKVSRDGRTLNSETVVERTKLPGGVVRIVTEKPGKDNDRDALFRYSYLLSQKNLSIKKEVRYEGTTEFFERNEYSWKR